MLMKLSKYNPDLLVKKKGPLRLLILCPQDVACTLQCTGIEDSIIQSVFVSVGLSIVHVVYILQVLQMVPFLRAGCILYIFVWIDSCNVSSTPALHVYVSKDTLHIEKIL